MNKPRHRGPAVLCPTGKGDDHVGPVFCHQVGMWDPCHIVKARANRKPLDPDRESALSLSPSWMAL